MTATNIFYNFVGFRYSPPGTPGVYWHGKLFLPSFVPAAACIMKPLFQALVGNPKTLQWDEKMISAFNLAKEVLARATMHAHPHADASTAIIVDASG